MYYIYHVDIVVFLCISPDIWLVDHFFLVRVGYKNHSCILLHYIIIWRVDNSLRWYGYSLIWEHCQRNRVLIHELHHNHHWLQQWWSPSVGSLNTLWSCLIWPYICCFGFVDGQLLVTSMFMTWIWNIVIWYLRGGKYNYSYHWIFLVVWGLFITHYK